MNRNVLCSSFLLALSLTSSARAGVADDSAAPLYWPDAFAGEASGADVDALPRGVSGLVPELDGEPFFLEVEAGLYTGRDSRSVRAALAEILPGVGFRGDVDALSIGEPTWLNTASERDVAEMREADGRALEERLTRRVGELSRVTLAVLDGQADENEALLLRQRGAVRVRQVVDGRPVRGLGLRVSLDEDGTIVGIAGALADLTRLDGAEVYGAERAEGLAAAEIGASERVSEVGAAEAIAIATGHELRPAWRVVVTSALGSYYEVVVDAESGITLGVASLTDAFASAEGLTYWPDPDGITEVQGFEVDNAVGGDFSLAHADIGTVTSGAADGCMATAQVPDSNGYADFNVAPFNGTSVEDVNDAGYNCNFQEVNAMVQVTNLLYWFDGLGAEPSPPIPIRVDMGNSCGGNTNQACAGGGMLTFGLGTATLGNVSVNNLFNSALDVSVIAHELGHHVTRRQIDLGGGTLTGSMSEGLSDYWSMAYTDTDTFGPYWGKTTGMAVQNGFVPRRAESFDVFPEHMVSNNEAHANGQMIAWAEYGFRTEMADRSAIGAGLASRMLIDSLPSTGFGVTNNLNTRKEVYGSFQSLLATQLLEVGLVQARVDMLQAYARAGIFTTKHEAVIDISDDYLAPTDAPPTFTVWPGQDFVFDAAGSTTESTAFNQNYEIELANDADFTVNLVSSGTLSNFAEAATGNTFGTWTPSAKQWDALTGGSMLYYRVHTWDDKGGTKRDSEHTMAGLMQVPTAAAVINGGGSAGCSTTGTGAFGGLGLLVAGLALVQRRR